MNTEKKRQNTSDIEPTLLENRLKYGLSIMVDLEDFDLEKTPLEKIDFEAVLPSNVLMKEVEILQGQRATKIIIPENSHISTPIKMVSKTTRPNTLQHIIFDVGKNATVVILDFLKDETDTKGHNKRTIEINAKKNSKVSYIHIQTLSKKKLHIQKKLCIADESATINWKDFIFGGKVVLSETKSILAGESSCTDIQSIFFSEKSQQLDVFAQVVHEAKNTSSNLQARGAVNSKALYRGSIHMGSEAFRSSGFQKTEVLLLDDGAEADAIPQLLIDNNDVKCSHAVAIGRIDPEKIFYLMSRGITEEKARREIVRGFFESTFCSLPSEEIKELLEKILKKQQIY